MRATLSLSLAALLCATAQAEPAKTTIPADAVTRATALRDAAMKDDTAYQVVESLTTEIGPRLAGSPNDARAVAWAQAKFKALGYDKVWTEPVTYAKWVRRSESAELVAPYPQKLAVLALGGSSATPAGGITADIVAFDNLDAFKAADPAKVKGRIVYVADRMKAMKDGRDYGRVGKARHEGPALAQTRGAAAFVMRSVGSDSDRLPHTGVTDWTTSGGHPLPAAALSNADADLLDATLRRGQPVRMKLALDCGVEGQYTGANVIGQFNGSTHPEEIVAMSGHLDSWDPGTGAIDAGAGVAIAMAAGHLIGKSAQKPKRSIRVIAFAAEEPGELGGKAYALAHKDEVGKHVLGSESDFGAGPVWRLRASVKPEAAGAIQQIVQVLAPLGVTYAEGKGEGGSDLSQMHEIGMAGLSLTQDGTRYFDWHHTANDTLDKIVPAELQQNVAVYAAWAYMAAEADGDFGSAPGAFAADSKE